MKKAHGAQQSTEGKFQSHPNRKDNTGIRRDIDAKSYKKSETSKNNHMKSIKMEDIDFEPTNYLETNLVIKEEFIENDKSLAVVPREGIKLEESGSDKEKVVAKMIFCLKCGDHFEKAEDLYLHVEGNLECETKENLQFLSKQGENQKGEETVEENNETNLVIKEEVIEKDHNLANASQPLKNKRGKYKKNKKKEDNEESGIVKTTDRSKG